MKIKSALVAILLTIGLAPGVAQANVRPVVESFSFTPNDLDLISANTNVNFELVVSHPSGIRNISTIVKLVGPNNNSLATVLTRADVPLNASLNKVVFKGTLIIPQGIAAGTYTLSVDELTNNATAGYEYSTGIITPKKIRDLMGAESSLLIRSNGDLNLSYDTFVGPTHKYLLNRW